MQTTSSGARAVRRPMMVVVAVAGLTLGACTGEEAIPIDPDNPPVVVPDLTDVTHLIPPTDQMREAAEQQCLDDLGLVEGYVRAVDPQSGAVMSELTVDCDDVHDR